MRKLLSIIWLVIPITFLSLNAQDEPGMQDPSAEIYLDRVAEDFSGEEPLQVEFNYEIYSNREEASVSDFGSIIIKDSRYKLKTEDSEVYFNGEKMWTYLKANEEVYLSYPEPGNVDPMMTNPFSLLSNYKEYYKYQNKGQVDFDGKKLTEIDLYPKDLETNYSILRLRVSQDGRLHSLTMKQKGGIDITVYINEVIRSIKVPDSSFEWNEEANPDVLLIEM